MATGSLDSITNNATTVTEPTGVATAFTLDAAGNRLLVDKGSGSGTTNAVTVYSLFDGGSVKDKQVNQYTATQTFGADPVYMAYDETGNTYTNGTNRYFWDASDHLVQVLTATDDVRYAYDALGRRIAKRSTNALFTTVLYWWDGWRTLEETDQAGSPNLLRRYVHGAGIDEPIRVTLQDVADVDNDANTSEFVDLYYHDNSIGSVVAMTRSDGAVVEAYRYDAYGEVIEILNKSGSVVTETAVKQPFFFQGRRRDFEEQSGLMYFRNRYYDPKLGRFISRDPLGVWGDPGQMGNAQSAFGNNPGNVIDPFGLDGYTVYVYPRERREEAKAAQESLEKFNRLISRIRADAGTLKRECSSPWISTRIAEREKLIGDLQRIAKGLGHQAALQAYYDCMVDEIADASEFYMKAMVAIQFAYSAIGATGLLSLKYTIPEPHVGPRTVQRGIRQRGAIRIDNPREKTTDQKRVNDQLKRRRIRRENMSRAGTDMKRSGEGHRDHVEANKGPKGTRADRGPSADGRERNVGHPDGEEHIMRDKAGGGGKGVH